MSGLSVSVIPSKMQANALDSAQHASARSTLPALILCGPQTPLSVSKDFAYLQKVLSGRSIAQSIASAVDKLPDVFQRLALHDARLQRLPGTSVLGSLRQWLNTGQLGDQTSPLPNILALPLTVLLQVAQYVWHLDRLGFRTSHEGVLERLREHGVQGFCIGFLTAAAISGSSDDHELAQMTIQSLRLAVCIGAYIDLDLSITDSPPTVGGLSVRWKAGEHSKEGIAQILELWPNVSRG